MIEKAEIDGELHARLKAAGLNPLGTPVGHASQALQKKLEQ